MGGVSRQLTTLITPAQTVSDGRSHAIAAPLGEELGKGRVSVILAEAI
jgi:hypothetical protein